MSKESIHTQKIKEWVQLEPWLTYQDIANRLGLTRERVRQIINKDKIEYPSTQKPIDVKIGTELYSNITNYLKENPKEDITETRLKFNVSAQIISAIRNEIGLQSPEKEKIKDRVERIKEFVKENNLDTQMSPWRASEIAQKFEISVQQLNRIQNEHQIRIMYPVGNKSDKR